MMELLNKLVKLLSASPAVTLTEHEGNVWDVVVHAGRLPHGIEYDGLWGAGVTLGNELTYCLQIGDLWGDDECNIGTATVQVYTDSDGMPYSSSLETTLSDMLHSATNGVLKCSGSEQGMQDYSAREQGYCHMWNADVEYSV